MTKFHSSHPYFQGISLPHKAFVNHRETDASYKQHWITLLVVPTKLRRFSMPLQRKPSIVFVHGLWADGSCFSKLIPTLQNEGFEVIASQHGLDSHASDVDCVKRTLGRVINPAILVVIPMVARSSRRPAPTHELQRLSTSRRLPRMPTRQHKVCKRSFRQAIFFPISRLQTDAFG